MGLPRWLSSWECARQCRRCRFGPWVGEIPWRRKWQPTPVFLPGKSHGRRSLAGYSPWGLKRVGHDLVIKWLNNIKSERHLKTLLHLAEFSHVHVTKYLSYKLFLLEFSISLTQNKNSTAGNSLAVQWLGLYASTAGCMGSTSGRGTKISEAVWQGR